MVQFTLVLLFRTKYLAKVNMCGLTQRLTMENGTKIKCMDMVYSYGSMARSTKVTSSTTSVRAKESSLGKTEEFTMVCGKKVSNMAEVNSQLKKVRKE
jgi:hypothetical protein